MDWNSESRQVIQETAEGNNTIIRAALQLNLSQRTIKRKMQLYREQGEACFKHGNTGKPSPKKISLEEITELITGSPMEGANFTEISRLLEVYHGRHINPSTLR